MKMFSIKMFKINKTCLVMLAAVILQLCSLNSYADDSGGQTPAQKATTEASAGGGSGAITPDLFTGTMSYAIPIDVPPGRNGMAPDINLLYRSGNGNGWIGVGWELEVGSIVRSLKNGVDYNGDYQLRMAGASLDLVDIGNGEYRANIEGAFYRIKKMTTGYWEVTDKRGTKYLYGQTRDSRQDDPLDPNNPNDTEDTNKIFKWCLDKVEDTNGNYMTLTYYKNQTESTGQIYLDRIDYNGNYVQFNRDTRTDVLDMYTTNFKVKTAYRLKTIDVFANGNRVRKYELDFQYGSNTGRSLLTSVTQYGSDGATTLPTTTLTYYDYNTDSIYNSNQTITGSYGMSGHHWSAEYRQLATGDFNGDGKMDIILQGKSSGRNTLLLTANSSSGFDQQDITISYGMSADAWDAGQRRLLTGDFNGDGKIDILLQGTISGNNTLLLIANSSGGFNNVQTITNSYGMSGQSWSAEYRYLSTGDFNGDGKTDLLLQGTTSDRNTLLLMANSSSGFDQQTITTSYGMSADAWSAGQRRLVTGDFNGDGKTDILLQGTTSGNNTLLLTANSSGGFDQQTITTSYGMSGDAWDASQRRLATGDFNGDGKTDILLQGISNNNTLLLTANGSGGFNNAQTITNSYGMSWSAWSTDQSSLATGDFNGDGKTDLLLQGTISGNNTLLLAANSSGGFDRLDITNSYGMSTDLWAGDKQYLAAGDFNGDGKTDLLLQGAIETYNTFRLTANTTPQNLLYEVRNGLGSITDIYYAPSTTYTNTQLPFSIQTLSSVTVNDGNYNISTTNYTYSGGYYYIPEKDFRGFNYVKVTGQAGPNGEQAITETWFHQGIDTTVDANDPNVSIGYMKGKPYRTKVTDGSGNKYSETTTSYTADNTAPYFNPPLQVDASTCDGDTCGKSTKTVYSYDSYGNLTREDRYGDTSDSADDLTVTRSFTTDSYTIANTWIIGLPTNESVYQGIGTATKVAGTDYYYDGVTDCNTASTTQVPTKGKLTRAIRWLSGGANPEIRMAYDSYGNLICSRDANGNPPTTITYDSSYTFPKIVTNPLGYQVTTKYYGVDGETGNGLYGQVKTVTDPNNAVTSYEYDAFGRKTKTTQADNSYTNISYNNLGWGVGTQNISTSNSTGLSTWTYFDGFGRTYLEKSTGPDSRTIGVITGYDARGAVRQKSLPYFEGYDSPRYATYTHDPIGRVTRVDKPDGGTNIKSCYNDWVSVVIDENGHRKRETKDAFGRLIKVEEYTGSYATCDTSQGTPYATTTYQYDVLGNLRFVTDASGNQTEMRYDTLNRKTYMHDPDMSNWNYYYDNNGNLTSQVDSMNQWIYFQYDALNRLRQKDYTTQKTLGSGDVVYTYDGATSYGKGRLTNMRDSTGQEIIFYDTIGRVNRTDKMVGTIYSTRTSYDGMGRISSIIYPDNTTINYSYNGPFLQKVYDGGTNYAQYSEYNAVGQSGTVTYGNGVVTNYTYFTGNQWLGSIYTKKGTNVYQNKGYSYDSAGNVASITDYFNGNQSFSYDELNRLTTANSSLYGSIVYAYDTLGNMTTNTRIGTYTYPTNGVRPHAVTQAGSNTYIYDANGNMTSGAGRTITYDPENRPKTISGPGLTSTLYYDGNGERVKKVVSTTTTTYVGKLYECTTGKPCEKFIFANGQRIAKKGGSTYYYHQDHLGSSDVITDIFGNKVEAIRYYPYGQTAFDSGTSVNVNHKYTSQELDRNNELYFYNARYYDPALGRFISADSIIPDPGDPQSFNRYSYVRNNPINLIDPSGHWSIKIGGTWIKGDDKTTAIVASVAAAIVTGGAAYGLTYGLVENTMIAGAVGGAIGGATSAVSMQAMGYQADIGKATLMGAVGGAAFGGIASLGLDRVGSTVTSAFAGGFLNKAFGGSFEQGFVVAGTIAGLANAASYMRETMIAQSRINPENASGESVGFNGDGFKLGGGRVVAGQANQTPSPLGGVQGGQGRIFGMNYAPGSSADRVVEAFAGPHDYFNSGYWYNAAGNARNLTGTAAFFGEALNYTNVMTVTPFVGASAVPNYIYPMVVNYSN